MSKPYAMQSRSSLKVAEPSKSPAAKQQRAIEAFETSLFTRDREAVLNRKLFALKAAEFLCEINGLPDTERRRILEDVFSLDLTQLESVSDESYLREWGDPANQFVASEQYTSGIVMQYVYKTFDRGV